MTDCNEQRKLNKSQHKLKKKILLFIIFNPFVSELFLKKYI